MTIARILENHGNEVWSCNAGDRVAAALEMLATRRIGALPVFDGGQVVGIFSERDVIYQLQNFGPAMLDKQVEEVMTSPAITVEPSQDVLAALALMTRRRIRHLPVVEGAKLVGFVSIGDLVKYRIERIESEAEAMRAYIQSA